MAAAAPMRITSMFAAYGGVHVSRVNIAFHVVGIPMIYGGAIGLLRFVPALPVGGVRLDLGMLVLVALVYLWARLHTRLAILAALIAPALWLGAAMLSLKALAFVFLAGNAIPLAGHVFFEKGGPKSLNEGLAGTLIAPLWVLNLAVRQVPVR